MEESHFWFRARNELIVWALGYYAPDFKTFLEIGCGTGFVLTQIATSFPDANLKGSEIFTEGLSFTTTRLPRVELAQMDARQIPYSEEFDAIGAFDVLEHIKEDETVLGQLNKALKPNGTVFLTVPQHKWLWSPSDEYALHERRYCSAEITAKLKKAGFEILRSTSFVTFLLPAMMLSRFAQRKQGKEFDPYSELKIGRFPNSLFEKVLKTELAGIKLGLNFPAGGSRLVVARKLGEK